MADALSFALEVIVILHRKCAEMKHARAALARLDAQLPSASTLIGAVLRIWNAVEERRMARDGQMGADEALDPVEVQRALMEPAQRVARHLNDAQALLDKVDKMGKMKQWKNGSRVIGEVDELQQALALAISALNANLQAWRTSIEINGILDATGLGGTPFELPPPPVAPPAATPGMPVELPVALPVGMPVDEAVAVAGAAAPPAAPVVEDPREGLRAKLARYPGAMQTRRVKIAELTAANARDNRTAQDWLDAFGKTEADPDVAELRARVAANEALIATHTARLAQLEENQRTVEAELAAMEPA